MGCYYARILAQYYFTLEIYNINYVRRTTLITRKILQRWVTLALFALSACSAVFSVQAEDKKPNIVIIWGDDIGQSKA